MAAVAVLAEADDGTSMSQIAGVTAVPALAMALGSAAISAGEPSERLQARLQHFSAGLLIGAVVTDIFPILRARLVREASGDGPREVRWAGLLAAFAGFALALLLMYGVKSLEMDGDDEAGEAGERKSTLEEADRERQLSPDDSLLGNQQLSQSLLPGGERGNVSAAIARLDACAASLSALVEEEEVDREAVDEAVHTIDFRLDAARRSCRKSAPVDPPNALRLRHHATELAEDVANLRSLGLDDLCVIDNQLKVVAATLRHIHSHVDRGIFRRWRPQPRPSQLEIVEEEARAPVPWGLVAAVVIDSILDGMLIGLAGSVALMSGWLMAMATAIEMGFLGYSFACSLLKSLRRFRAMAILSLPPLAMMAASMTAYAGASYVAHQPAFVALIAFALVALLFLVMEELLLEAHEKEGSEVWHISGCLYLGLLLSICLDVAV